MVKNYSENADIVSEWISTSFSPGSGTTYGNSSFEALTPRAEWGRGSYPGVRCAVYKYLPAHPGEDHPFLSTWQSGWVT